tara:strand:- start:1169 stop:1888 length:720 start_codon:yes stop_codon:yes gene_type:complete
MTRHDQLVPTLSHVGRQARAHSVTAIAVTPADPTKGASSSAFNTPKSTAECACRRSARSQHDEGLKPEVMRVFAENFGVYGVRKVWRQMQRGSVARMMRDLGLQGVIRGMPVRTTISDKAASCPPDHVNRQFRASAPTVPGSPVLPMWPSLSTCMPAVSWAGGSAAPPMPASCWTLSIRVSTTAAPSIAAVWFIIRTAGRKMPVSATASAWPRPQLPSVGSVGDSYYNPLAESIMPAAS